MQPDDKTQKAAKDISQTIDKQDPPAGYPVAELLDAPVKPLQAAVVEATSNHRVVFIIGGAGILFAVGILLAVFSFVLLGIILVAVAAILVLLGVFLPIR